MPSFRLVPFPAATVPPGFSVEGEVEREGAALHARYRISSPHGSLVIPKPAVPPTRRDGLWQSTCAELFVGAAGATEYVELNLSPSGDWNAYRFSDYRAGMSPLDGDLEAHPQASPTEGTLAIGFTLALPTHLADAALLDVAITSVLEHTTGPRTYWALAHTAPAPDFHRRDSFTLRLPLLRGEG